MSIDRSALVDFLTTNYALDPNWIEDDTALFSEGILDSFSVAEILLFLEDKGGFAIEPDEVIMENFDSISSMLTFAKLKSSQK